MIKKLEDHYLPEPQHAEDHQQLLVEWQKAKYDLLQWKENDLPQAICEGEGSTTATDSCLSKLMQSPYRSHYPMLPFIAEVCLSCPVSNASPERGASMLKWQKNRLWSQIKNHFAKPLAARFYQWAKTTVTGVAILNLCLGCRVAERKG